MLPPREAPAKRSLVQAGRVENRDEVVDERVRPVQAWASARSRAGRTGSPGGAPQGAARPAPRSASRRRPRAGGRAGAPRRSRRTRGRSLRLTLACRGVEFEHVLVVGAGQMGGGIAQVAAAAGCRVSLHDAAPGATDRALETMRRSLAKLAEKGGADPDEVLGRIEPVDDLVAADLMVEAVVEDTAVKEDIFRRADDGSAGRRRSSPRTLPRFRSPRSRPSRAGRTRSSACTSSIRCRS